MKKRISKFDWMVIILSVFMYGAVMFLPFKAKSLGDLDFHLQAKHFAQVLWGQADFNTLVINKAPGPVFFYVIPYFCAGPDAADSALWRVGVLWSFLFLTGSLLLIRKAALNFGNETAGKIAVIFLLILPLHLYYSLGILAESLAFVGCSFFLYGWSVVVKKRTISGWRYFVLGLLCVLMARPNSLLIIPFLVLCLLYFSLVKKDQFYVAIRRSFFLAIIALTLSIAVLGWLVKSLPGNKTTSTQEGYLAYVMLIGRFQFREETWDWRFWDGSNRAGSKDYQAYQTAKLELKKKAADEQISSSQLNYEFVSSDIISHPFQSLKQFMVRILFGHILQVNSLDQNSFGIGPLRGRWFFWLFHIGLNVVNGIFILSAIVMLFRREFDGKSYIPLIIPWLALVIFHGIVYMEPRYIFPTRGIIVLLGSIVIVPYLEKKFRGFKKIFK